MQRKLYKRFTMISIVFAMLTAALALQVGTTNAANTIYISDEVGGSSAQDRVQADGLDDVWRSMVVSSGSCANCFEGSSSNTPSSLLVSDGNVISVELRDMTNFIDTSDLGVPANTQGGPGTATSNNLQDGSPKPDSLAGFSSYNENSGSTSSRNGLLFNFTNPVQAFGAYFGDVETRTDGQGVPAVVRLYDTAGVFVNESIILPTEVDQSKCGAPVDDNYTGCGNQTTRWIGFVADSAEIGSMVIIVGDDDSNGDANTEHLSVIGLTVANYPDPTPTPQATATPAPTATATAEPSPVMTPFVTSTPMMTPQASVTTTPVATPSPTPKPQLPPEIQLSKKLRKPTCNEAKSCIFGIELMLSNTSTSSITNLSIVDQLDDFLDLDVHNLDIARAYATIISVDGQSQAVAKEDLLDAETWDLLSPGAVLEAEGQLRLLVVVTADGFEAKKYTLTNKASATGDSLLGATNAESNHVVLEFEPRFIGESVVLSITESPAPTPAPSGAATKAPAATAVSPTVTPGPKTLPVTGSAVKIAVIGGLSILGLSALLSAKDIQKLLRK